MAQAQIDQACGLFRNEYTIPQHPRSEALTKDEFNGIMQTFKVDPDTAIWSIYHNHFNSIRQHHYESAWRGANSVSIIVVREVTEFKS